MLDLMGLLTLILAHISTDRKGLCPLSVCDPALREQTNKEGRLQILNGREVAQKIKQELKQKTEVFEEQTGKKPGLAVILSGTDPASEIYVQQKIRSAKEVGIYSKLITLPEKSTFSDLEQKIDECNLNPAIHAFLVQLALPKGWPVYRALSRIESIKDADGLNPISQGLLMSQANYICPCTPAGIMRLFKYYNIALEGKSAVVVGRSQIVGRPMAELLLQAHATVTICHSRTKDLSAYTQRADIVVVSAGVPRLLGQKDFKKGAIVVDVGLHRIKKGDKIQLIGDVRSEGLKGHLSWVTPVPGGVGPMTVAMLLENTFTLATKQELSHKANYD